MRHVTAGEVADLAEKYHLEVDGTEVDDVVETVNEKLEGLDEVYDLPLPRGGPDGDRSWHEPGENPHTALAVACEVPPASDATDRLEGMAIGVKDNIVVGSVPMECGSAVLRGYVPGFDAAVIERLRGAGARITAKTNLDEFAASGRGASFLGQITNPHDEGRASGGSSGGSAVAVATGVVDAALGTDTGGSIRLPSCYCGVVGFKPTYGLAPIHGIVENTYTFDHVGPLARSVGVAADVAAAMVGVDERDPASVRARGRPEYRDPEFDAALARPPGPEELTIGLVEEGIGEGAADEPVEPPVVKRTEAVVDALVDAGATVERCSIPEYELAQPVKFCISLAELAAHWRAGGAPFRRGGGSVDEGFQVELARRGWTASAETNAHFRARMLAGARLIEGHHGRHYSRALAARAVLRDVFADPFEEFDALLTPTAPALAPSLARVERPVTSTARNTIPANVTGQPAVSIPAGTVEGVPVGVQLVGESFYDDELLGTAAAVGSVLE
jgi:amidase/aspartyl-tRNA(Asn)/glutamyl-tRNA(Gln) amidotransferase subunit A